MRPDADYLTPLPSNKKAKRHKFLTVDIESKDEDTQKAGFTRPFLVGVYDGEEYVEFRNEPHLKSRPWEDRHVLPGGCVDKALEYMLQPRYAGRHIYAHNGGNFDHLFWLRWLRRKADEFRFEVIPVASSIQKIGVTRREEETPLATAGDDEAPESGTRLSLSKPQAASSKRKKKRAKLTWSFLDSMKLYPQGLEKMLKTFGLASKVAHDLHMHEEDPRWSHYLSRDCLGLYEALVRFHDLIENELGGEVGMTTPATAMKLFRRRFIGKGECPDSIPRHVHFSGCPETYRRKKKNDKPKCQGCCHDFVTRAYYGGRTEVLESRGTALHYYDINSSYVAAMRETMPAGERLVEERPTHGIDWRRHEKYVGFAEVDVEVPASCHLPPLPHRSRDTGKLIFPAGRFRGVWDLEELQLLTHPKVRGRILHVDRIVWFKRRYLFRDMVDVLWALRDPEMQKVITGKDEFDEGLSQLAKLLGNSGYGKFGMKKERTQVVFRLDSTTPEECFLCRQDATEPGGLCNDCDGSKPANGDPESDVWYQRKRVDAPYIIPQIAAHITSLARVRLWRFMMKAYELTGRLMYGDTDSIVTPAVFSRAQPNTCKECRDVGFCFEHPIAPKLGALKDEYPGKELDGVFLQPKVYMLQESSRSREMRAHDRFAEAWAASPLAGGTMLDHAAPHREKAKVTMKGFPQSQRTPENLMKLREGASVRFDRLEKVRSMARRGFFDGPMMARDGEGERGVKKGFRSKYDKRVLREDGTTAPLVLDELFEEAAE